jgi:hypothetical protein
MSKTEARTGLTNILKRFAYYCFLKFGLGHHKLKDNAHYDEVEIKELYPWMSNPENPDEYGGGVSVTFYKDSEKIRFIEFSIRFTGGGGRDIIRRIK